MPTIAEVHATPAKPDGPPTMRAVVLTKKRVIRQGQFEYHVPVGTVVHTRMLPPSTTFTAPEGMKLVEADHKVGDIIEV